MKYRIFVMFTLLLVLVSNLPITHAQDTGTETCVPGQGRQYRGGRGGSDPCEPPHYFLSNLPPVTAGVLSEEIIQTMTNGIMDEYNAYAIYGAVIVQFGAVRPFTNIQRAEAQHISAWEFIFTRYGLPVPEAPEVTVPEFATIEAACQAAAEAEVANYQLYDVMLETLQDYPDMVQVVTQLRNVSQYNHLSAFQRCAGY